jgi:hypothetical protein
VPFLNLGLYLFGYLICPIVGFYGLWGVAKEIVIFLDTGDGTGDKLSISIVILSCCASSLCYTLLKFND